MFFIKNYYFLRYWYFLVEEEILELQVNKISQQLFAV